jgi:hypothetical protein
MRNNLYKFSAMIIKLGINPCVDVPHDIVSKLYGEAKKEKGPIPVKVKLQGNSFNANVVKYKGGWRLYLNYIMRRDAGVDVGDTAKVELQFDPEPRIEPVPKQFADALKKNKNAKKAFDNLSPSRQKEILRYLNYLKTEDIVLRHIKTIVQTLSGEKVNKLNYLFERK